jgi:uncharacterized protein (TIGR00299 family) protein
VSDNESVTSRQRIMVIDCQVAGVSGDMLLGALVDLGASPARISEALSTAVRFLNGCRDLRIEVKTVSRCGIRAQKADVLFEEEASSRNSAEIREAVAGAAQEIALSGGARKFAINAVETLTHAEKTVHGQSHHHDVHFHEIGSADTVADILGVTVALDELGIFADTTVYTTPIAVGEGSLKISHGTVAIPAPATLEILRVKQLPMLGGAVASELATPTGVSLVGNLAHKVTHSYPPMKPLAIGYGAGTKEFSEMANVVRITLGEPLIRRFQTDEIYVLETNLDDLSGEVIGYTTERLLKEGARDCCIIPIYAKKNRPGQILQVITDRDNIERLTQVLIEETGTLGVRFFPCDRFTLARESLLVEVPIGGSREKVRVKVSRDASGRVLQVKPEYMDARRLAESSGCSLREVLRLIQKEAWHEVSGEDRQDS